MGACIECVLSMSMPYILLSVQLSCSFFSYSYQIHLTHDYIKLQYFPKFSIPQYIQRDISNQNNCYLFGMWSQKYFQSFSFSMWYSQPTSKTYLSFCYCIKMSILSWISFYGMLFRCFLFWHRLRKREPKKNLSDILMLWLVYYGIGTAVLSMFVVGSLYFHFALLNALGNGIWCASFANDTTTQPCELAITLCINMLGVTHSLNLTWKPNYLYTLHIHIRDLKGSRHTCYRSDLILRISPIGKQKYANIHLYITHLYGNFFLLKP